MKLHARWLIVGGTAIWLVSLSPIITGLLNRALKNRIYIRLDKAKYTVKDKPVLKISNCGPNVISFGYAYKMEKMINGEWVEVPATHRDVPSAWPAGFIVLPPSKEFRQSIDLSGFDLGEYRICKTVKDEVTEISKTFKKKFARAHAWESMISRKMCVQRFFQQGNFPRRP